MAVLTNWPAQGLPLVWKEPVGIGYASFSVADGRAYTIEQRRSRGSCCRVRREHWTRSLDPDHGMPRTRMKPATAHERRQHTTMAGCMPWVLPANFVV